MGHALLDTALTLRTDAVVQWHREALPMFNAALPSRILNNLACCMVGLRLMEAMLARLGLAWGQVFSVGIDACVKYLEYGIREYLLDGGNSNKSIVEQTMEVIDRMGLTTDEFRTLPDGNAAFFFKGFYLPVKQMMIRRKPRQKDQRLSVREDIIRPVMNGTGYRF